MNEADRSILRAIGNNPYPHDVALTKLAGIVETLCQSVDAFEHKLNAVMEQQGLATQTLGKLDRTVETLIEESAEKLPVDGKDWLDPNRPAHFHTPDSQACWSKDCFTAECGFFDCTADDPSPLCVEHFDDPAEGLTARGAVA